jgi:hypothetical protein
MRCFFGGYSSLPHWSTAPRCYVSVKVWANAPPRPLDSKRLFIYDGVVWTLSHQGM